MEEPYGCEEIELSQEMREVEVCFDLLPCFAPLVSKGAWLQVRKVKVA